MLILTIVMRNSGKVFDIMVKPEQRIMNILQVLTENGQIILQNLEKSVSVRSWRKGSLINCRLTFKQENIYSGDILYIAEERYE